MSDGHLAPVAGVEEGRRRWEPALIKTTSRRFLRFDLNPKTAPRKLRTPISLGAETQLVGICLKVHSWMGGPRLPRLQQGTLPVTSEMAEVSRALPKSGGPGGCQRGGADKSAGPLLGGTRDSRSGVELFWGWGTVISWGPSVSFIEPCPAQ